MKRVIRKCVWETNSSMTHSCIIMPADQYKRWEENNLYFYNSSTWWDPFKKLLEEQKPKNGLLYTEDEAVGFLRLIGEEYNEADYNYVDQFLSDFRFYKCDYWYEDEYCEYDTTNYITPNGEELVIACKYGRDG